jgi:hypothetical protein
MKYDPLTKRITIKTDDIDRAWHNIRWAIRAIRQAAGRPLEGGPDRDGPLDDADFAEAAILKAAEAIGLDLGPGSDRAGRLDVRDTN